MRKGLGRGARTGVDAIHYKLKEGLIGGNKAIRHYSIPECFEREMRYANGNWEGCDARLWVRMGKGCWKEKVMMGMRTVQQSEDQVCAVHPL